LRTAAQSKQRPRIGAIEQAAKDRGPRQTKPGRPQDISIDAEICDDGVVMTDPGISLN
jgi:hypothetical protein